MKNYLPGSLFIFLSAVFPAQTLTTVSGKRIYDHHSSSLSNGNYGFYNVNSQSAYDFVNHVNVPSGVAAQAPNRDLVEHNGYFGWNGSKWGIQFGFTNATSNIGTGGYQGNNTSSFYLDNSFSFANLNNVSDLVAAYDPAQAKAFDTAVAVGNIYIGKIRNTDLYVAMKITNVSNITPAQATAMDNGQTLMADVYFEFDYKYGVLTTTFTAIHENSSIANAVKLYPNPASGQLFLSSITHIKQYRIMSMAGVQAAEGNTKNLEKGYIDIQGLPSGIYFLELKNDSGVIQRNMFVRE